MPYLELDITFTTPEDTTDVDFEAFIDCVLEELSSIGRTEVDVLAILAEARVQFTDRVPERSIDQTVNFLADLRTALHAANCLTANWPTLAEVSGMTSRDADLTPA